MASMLHDNKTHQAACNLSEGQRQVDVQNAMHSGGDVQAAVKAAEIAHYRRVIASCAANGIAYGDFVMALRDLGTGSI